MFPFSKDPNKEESLMNVSKWASTLALSVGVMGLGGVSFGDITGTAKLDGKAPERKKIDVASVPACAEAHPDGLFDESIVADANGNLENVVVYLKGDNIKATIPEEPAVLDQKGCQYVPHVIGMVVGQKLIAKNEDSFLHNVHTLPEDSEPTNIAQPNKDPGTALKPIKSSEVFPVKCDVHPWMKAWVYALDNQYFGVTGADGTFKIDTKGLPDGEYEIHAWQEKLKEAPAAKVTVKDGKGEVNFTFKPKTAAAADSVKQTETAGLTCPDCDAPAKAKPQVVIAK
jgi:hypothetical protein